MNNQMMTVMWLDSFRNQRTQMIWKMTMVNHQNHDDDSNDGGAGSDGGGVMRLFGRGFLSTEELGLKPCRLPASLENDS